MSPSAREPFDTLVDDIEELELAPATERADSLDVFEFPRSETRIGVAPPGGPWESTRAVSR